VTRSRAGEPVGANLLLSDIRVASLLVNEARYRALERVLGIPRDQANVATVVAVLLVLEALQDSSTQALRKRRPPSVGEFAFGVTAAREGLYAVAGPESRESPLFASVLMLAVLGNVLRPVVSRSLRDLRASSHGLDVKFRQRYGYLIDPGHWRARRAKRRADAATASAPSSTDRPS